MRAFIERAALEDVQLICFPECCVSGYWHLRNLSREALIDLAEPIPEGDVSQQILSWSREYNMTIGAGLVEREGDSLYNAYIVAAPDGQWWRHRKLHCFVSAHMTSGNEFTIFDMPNGWRAGILICYDNNLIENPRVCALAGAEMILAPHQTGGCNSGSPFAMGVVDRQLWDARETHPEAIEAEFRGDKGRGWLMRWLPARAHDNGMFYVFSNGVGPDDNEVRTGNAMLLDPYGRILAETCQAGDDMVIADFDASLRERCTGVRWMRARRPELYSELTQPRDDTRDTRAVRFDHLPKTETS
jgi:predicted amidohydrolase